MAYVVHGSSGLRTNNNYGGKVQAVIMDVEGVVCDYGMNIHADAMVAAFAAKNMNISKEQALTQGSGSEPVPKKNHITAILQSISTLWEDTHKKPFNNWDVEAIYKDFLSNVRDKAAGYANAVPGAVECIQRLQRDDVKVVASTDYPTEVSGPVTDAARAGGFKHDAVVTLSDVSADKLPPSPWRMYKAMENLGIWPANAIIRVAGTPQGIAEAHNAGMWTVGIARSPHFGGDSHDEFNAQIKAGINAAADRLYAAGAHVVIEGIWDFEKALDRIQVRASEGQKP
eukprot:GFYU01005889.1.p2 GENE.GFYU01005889.1~~GFYU01005889.1.p2  ORF type:complete len:285 (+),score=111.40 GFYU01005889.1:85-939(+)